MRHRRQLLVIILAELAGVGLLALLYMIFRVAPATPASAPPQVAAASLTPVNTPVPANTPTAPAAQALVTPTVAATLRDYTVVEGDTMWGIAVSFGLSLDELVAANPAIDPDRLYPGDTVHIPAPGSIVVPPAGARPTVPSAAQTPVTLVGLVSADSGGLRLRKGPSTSADILTKLPALASLTIVGRSADNFWLEVILSDGTRGWVMAQYVDVNGDLAQVGVTSTEPASASGNASTTAQSQPRDEPYISGISAKSKDIYRAGQTMGNRANVFALVGDSNTQNPAFFAPLDQGNYSLGDYGYLEDTIRYFRGSFGQNSPAAVGGFNTTKVLDPANAAPGCNGGESPLACEYRIQKPSVALILLGTGDQHTWQGFEDRYRRIIEYTIAQGIIPVVITKGDDLESRDNNAPYGYINSIIARLSREYDVPLLDLRQAISYLPNRGFTEDGFHFNAPSDNKSCYFFGDYLKYGYTMRNLTALQMLDAIRRQVLVSS